MKKIILFLSAIMTFQAQAQQTLSTMVNESQPSFAFNIEPVWLALSGIGAKAEYFVTDRLSIGLGGILIPKHTIEKSTQDDGSTASEIGGDYKWEYNEISLGTNIMLTGSLGTRGLYLNPGVGYRTTQISEYSEDNLSGSLSAPFVRLTMGYQWIIAKHLRLAAGGGFTVSDSRDIVIKNNAGEEVLKEKSSSLGGLALDLHVGYVF